jgi:DUF1365 family protein
VTAAAHWRTTAAALLSFFDSDHGDGRANAVQWLDELLRAEGIDDATGEAWLHCYPRVLGYTFKPVSFWYCHRAAADGGALRAIVVEVNNTFGERHCYLLDAAALWRRTDGGQGFSRVAVLQRRRRLPLSLHSHRGAGHAPRTVVRIDYDDANGPLLQTSVSGTLQPLTAACGVRCGATRP